MSRLIRLVEKSEFAEICALYQEAVADMLARGLEQWHWGVYPYAELLTEDVAERRLYCLADDGRIVGAFALYFEQGEEYADVPWHYGTKPVCPHRLALRPGCEGRGYAREMVAFAKEQGLRHGCDCLRVDTYEPNERARKLFSGMTTRKAGYFRLPWFPLPFHCYEAPLTETCPLLPVRMRPAYRYGDMTPWGGDGLRTVFGKDIPDARTGESLEISAIPGLESADDLGDTLPRLIALDGEKLVGAGNADPFPLLLKLICAKSQLSVQVHPNDAYAAEHEHKLGKTEAWAILHADEGARLLYGVRDGVTLADLRQALESGADVEPMIASIAVRDGDVFYMPSGMVHAIGGGILLSEIQQSSVVTYRLWDYNRVNDKGEKRPLHIKQSLDVIDPLLRGQRARMPDATALGLHRLLDVPAFTLDCLCVDGALALPAHPASFRMLTALDALTLTWDGGKLALQPGESALLPACAPRLTVGGSGRALVNAPGQAE